MNLSDRERKRAWKAEQKASAKEAFPLPHQLLASLFDFVDKSVGKEGCDHTRRFTESWLEDNRLSPEPVLKWLGSNAGYCDCEVISNAMDAWEENR
ncbi:MAG TPA: DUF2695 domain-containing protein [Pyrinomonadaceae bacterium]|nr:DUF2695 domain-containing protein [Pyrinomonadaceae bacterium]